MKKWKFFCSTLSCLLLNPLQPTYAADWQFTFGAHDFVVPEVDSHTFGLGVGAYGEHVTESGLLLSGYVDIYFDWDKDELDPDHIPIWFRTAFLTEGKLHRFSPATDLSWLLDLRGKRNTVSSVEKQFKFMPGISLNYDAENFGTGFATFAGLYYLEIDDDVPKTRGYGRSDYGHGTGAYSLMADAYTNFASAYTLSAVAQHWGSSEAWLENQYKLMLGYRSDSWVKGSEYIFSAEYTEYNIDIYAKVDVTAPGYIPILPWNTDLMVRAYVSMPWPF